MLARRWPALLLAVAIFVLYALYALSRARQYLTAGYDLGIFDQVVRAYSRFEAPMVPLKGDQYNVFADHFHPIVASIAPLYWLWDHPEVLLVVQALLVAASVPVFYGFALRRTNDRVALVVAGVYALGWPMQGLIDFDFHEIAFAVPLLVVAIDALDRRDDRVLLTSCALLLLVREDMGVIVATLGALRLLRPPRRLGAGMVAVGLVAAAVVVGVLIPSFAAEGRYAYWTLDALGADPAQALANVLRRPWEVPQVFFSDGEKVRTLFLLLAPLGLVALRSPYAIVALPFLAERFLNSREHLWTTQFHYNSLPWVVLALASVDGAGRLGLWGRARYRRGLLVWMVAWLVGLTLIPGHTPPLLERTVKGKIFATTARQTDQERAVAQVPANACVAVDDRLAPHLTSTNRVSLPGVPGPRPDYILLDLSQAEVGFQLPAPEVILEQALRNDAYAVTHSFGNLRVLEARGRSGPRPECEP